MLRKNLHLEYIAIARLGMEDVKEDHVVRNVKAHNTTYVIAESDGLQYVTHSSYKHQKVVWNDKGRHKEFYPENGRESWNVHPILQEGPRKGGEGINSLLTNITDFTENGVNKFSLLKCIHCQDVTTKNKEFSIYCDGDFKVMKYAGEGIENHCPRFSGIQYKSPDDEEQYYGQVVAIISYQLGNALERRGFDVQRPPDNVGKLYFLVARFGSCGKKKYKSRTLPLQLATYHRDGLRMKIECIESSRLERPMFYVPALDFGMKINDIGTIPTVNNMSYFYVLGQDTVQCEHMLTYDEYVKKFNTTKLSNLLLNKQYTYLHLNPFMSVVEMKEIREHLNTERNVEFYDENFIHDFEFDVEAMDEDIAEG